MALNGTYSGLQQSIADFLHRSDMTAVIPDLITLCEERIARDLRIRAMLATATAATTANTQAILLPTGWLEFENVTVKGNPDTQLNFVNIQHLDTKFPQNGQTGKPAVFTVEGSNVYLGPVPDGVYTVEMLYYKRFDALSTTSSNWLLTNYPSVYLFGALAEAQPFTMNDQRVGLWEQKYRAAVNDLQASDDRGQFSGTVLRVRTI